MALASLGIWLGFPNDLANVPPLAILWPLGLIALGSTATQCKGAFYTGWLATLAGSSLSLYWLSFPVHYVGKLPWPAAALCAILICACVSIPGAVYCALVYFLRQLSPLLKAIVFSLLWYLLEYLFALVSGFPWLPLSGALAAWPFLIQTANVVGAYFSSALWLCSSLLCIYGIAGIVAHGKPGGLPILCACMGIFLLAVLASYGIWRLNANPPAANTGNDAEISAIFVEGNIDQNQKWVPTFQRQTLDLYLDLTKTGLARAKSEGITRPLIIWPETALPFFIEKQPLLAARVVECARESGCALLFGAPGLEEKPGLPEGAVFNRAFLLDPRGALIGHYDKEHLVPFGEYLPAWLDFDFLESLVQGVGIYQEGTAVSPLHYDGLALGMLICYEGIFPWLAQERVEQGANILVDISNDGWFGNSPAARQHLFLTVPRCVEQNRWLLRSTNTGISAVIDPCGRLAMSGPMFTAGYLLATAGLRSENSFYHRHGWLIPWIASLLCVFLVVFSKRIKSHA